MRALPIPHLRASQTLQPLNQISTIGAIGLGFDIPLHLEHHCHLPPRSQGARQSLAFHHLEWTVPSPPGHGNFPKLLPFTTGLTR